jgi:hypothetical protein
MLTPAPALRDAFRMKESAMIDFCELTLPCLVLPPDTPQANFRIERRTDGPDLVLCNGQPIARSYSLGKVRPRKLGTVIVHRRSNRPVTLLLAATFNEASADDAEWCAYRAALVTLLQHQPRWDVQCETECDQLPLERIDVSIRELVWRLERLCQQPRLSMAFIGGRRLEAY